MLKRISIVLFSVGLGGCSLSEDTPQADFYITGYTVDFSSSTDNWQVDFADYPVNSNDSVAYDLTTGVEKMPGSTGLTGTGLLLSGKGNGDLFMFLKRKIAGLVPNTEYTIVFDVQVASNAPPWLVNSGAYDSPGLGVYLKVGAVGKEPVKIVDVDYYRMNIDKGNDGESGTDMITIGDVGVSPFNGSYAIITRSSSSVDTPITAHTNGNGELWLIVGTDSAFEGITALYYSRIDVVFSANNTQ